MTDPIIQTSNLNQTFRALRNNDPLKVQNQVVENHPDYKRVPKNNYAPIATVNTGNWGQSMMRTAAGQSGGMIYGQPQFFSPVHTPINWQMPSKRIESYQWLLLPDCQLLTEDYTYETTGNLNINGDVAYDDKTGGKIYDNVTSDAIFSGNGVLTKPSKFSSRHCENKECYNFTSYSSYHTFSVSEEHGVYVLDGTWLRKKRKVENNTMYRRGKGIVANGVCKVHIPYELISRKEAKDVSSQDYLISPSVPFGTVVMEGNNKAWMLGLCVADGSLGVNDRYKVHFTCSKTDAHVPFLQTCIAETFSGVLVNSRDHHSSDKAIVVSVATKQVHTFFRKYITGKLIEKKFTKDIFNLSQEEILNVLGGYFDGDGSFTSHQTLVANNYSEGMANQIWWMLIKCGIRASIRKLRLTGKHYPTASTHYYHIAVPSSDISKLLPYMRSGKVPADFIPKKDRDLSFFYEEKGVRYYCRSIRKIKKFLYTGVGYDMQIDVDRSYVLGGAKVSNCRFFYENEPKVASALDFYCFTPDTQILMEDGRQKWISSISAGERVRSHDGSSNLVEKVNIRTTQDESLLKIKISGVGGDYQSRLKVTPQHMMLTAKEDKIDFIPAGSLQVGDYLLTPCSYGDSNNTIDDDLAWLIGIYAAEGCALPYNHESKTGVDRRDHKGVSFTIHIDETDLQEQIISRVNKIYGNVTCSVVINQEHHRRTIKVYGQGVGDDMCGGSPGVAINRSKRLSPWVMHLCHNNLKNVLAGFFSGDGCYNVVNGFQGVGKSKILLEQIANICDKLGLEYSYTTTRLSDEERDVIHNVRISRRACDFANGLSYKVDNSVPTVISQAHIRNTPYFKCGNYIYRKITAIEQCKYSGSLYDLSIENAHSYVANRVSVHNSDFPMSGWDHECKDRKVKKYFDKMAKRLDLVKWCQLISHELHMLGDCFPMVEIACEQCGNTGKIGDMICEHEGGTVGRVIILNPDFVEVFTPPLNPNPIIALKADEDLVNMVQRKTPGIEKLTPQVVKLIASGQPIPLDNHNVGHLKYGECPYTKFGIGMIRRLFPILSYKTKLMVAQWIVAERLILPIKIVKVGSDERPAGPADIAAVQAQLAQTANDPNLTIVTHHAFELDWAGANGKVLTISNEFEIINQEILDGLMINNALLNGEGPCYHPDVEILTENGWKNYDEVADEEQLATVNPKNGHLEYQHFSERIIRDYNGDMVHFQTNKIDMLTTTNHRMWLQERTSKNKKEAYSEWKIVPAEDVKHRSKMRACIDGWQGSIPKEYINGIQFGKVHVESLSAFVEFLGYYLSEGYCSKKACGMCQNTDSYVTQKMQDCFEQMGIHYYKYEETNAYNDVTRFRFRMDIRDWLQQNVPGKSNNKFIPKWIKNLPKEYLWILLRALIDGDGSCHKNSEPGIPYWMYTTVSKKLANDVAEIAFKLGFAPTIAINDPHKENWQQKYVVNISNGTIGKFPVLDTFIFGNTVKDRRKCIQRVPYKGKVWCFHVPNEILVVRRNGKTLVCGNSFGNASVGIEAMIQRLKTFRSKISDWIEKFIYLPEARRQGFVTKDPDTGEDEYIVPKIKWHKMHLRDEQQQRTFVMQLYEKGLLSAPTVLEAFEYDPDNEIERKRYDMVQNLALGQSQGGQGAPGGMGGGGGGGGMPPMGDMGGGMPGAPGGAPGGDMGGGMPGAPGGAPGGGMGGAGGGAPVVAKASSLSAQTVDPNQFGGRVLKRRTRERLQTEQTKVFRQQQSQQRANSPVGKGQQQRDEKGRIIYTKPERMLMEKLIQAQKDGLIRYRIQPQFRVTSGEKEYPLDFAIPQLKLGIEADGEMFHGQPDQEAKDKARDMVLGQQGWTIARFKDYEIEDYPQKVLQTIIQNIMQKEIYIQQQAATLKQAQTEQMERTASESEELMRRLAESNESISLNDSDDKETPPENPT